MHTHVLFVQYTPLGYAVDKDNSDIVQLLIKYGASLSQKLIYYGRECYPMEFATANGKKVVQYLVPAVAAAPAHFAPESVSASPKLSGKMEDWTIDQVWSHFLSLGADESEIAVLRKEKIDGSALVGLTDDHLEKLGIPMGVRNKHKKAVVTNQE